MIGQTIGQYRIEEKLGEGGMGMVYRALDTKLNRPVAIKFLSDHLLDADAVRRFQREAQMASSLNHPHILTVYDAGDMQRPALSGYRVRRRRHAAKLGQGGKAELGSRYWICSWAWPTDSHRRTRPGSCTAI